MRDLLDHIRRALDADLYYLALFASLSIPAICSAMESDSGWETKEKYVEWFDQYVSPRYVQDGKLLLTGKDCRAWRNSLLHQGSSQPAESRYLMHVFVEPTTGPHLHRNIITTGGQDIINLDIRAFCVDIIEAAEEWLREAERTENYQRNHERFMRRRPEGLFVDGVEVPFMPGIVWIY